MSIRSRSRCTASRSWWEKLAAVQTIRRFRQSVDSAASVPSYSLTRASNS
ncbi:hypothetical protein ACFWNG_28190 [Streptomyces sp. NPDC058391]